MSFIVHIHRSSGASRTKHSHTTTPRRARACGALLLALTAAGCRSTPTAGPATAAAGPTSASTAVPAGPPPAPVLIHLPGIAGEMAIDHTLVRGLLRGGVAPVGTIFDWTGEDRGVPALTRLDRHRTASAAVADMIRSILRHDPRTPIVLVAHSAGTGVAVEALERLPPDCHVRTLVLLASALSANYDLTAALAHVDGRAVAFYSEYDNAVLGLGTRTFGTYDRVHSDAAGYVGFHLPKSHQAESVAYGTQLLQFPYDPAWAKLGNGGDHIGTTAGPFARTVLAPLINGDRPTTRP